MYFPIFFIYSICVSLDLQELSIGVTDIAQLLYLSLLVFFTWKQNLDEIISILVLLQNTTFLSFIISHIHTLI